MQVWQIHGWFAVLFIFLTGFKLIQVYGKFPWIICSKLKGFMWCAHEWEPLKEIFKTEIGKICLKDMKMKCQRFLGKFQGMAFIIYRFIKCIKENSKGNGKCDLKYTIKFISWSLYQVDWLNVIIRKCEFIYFKIQKINQNLLLCGWSRVYGSFPWILCGTFIKWYLQVYVTNE